MTARVTSALLVSALVRRADQEGGSAVVVTRGDATAGAILLLLYERGIFGGYRERVMSGDDRYRWQAIGPDADDTSEASRLWLERRRARDRDMWIVELDVPNAQRLIAETSGDD